MQYTKRPLRVEAFQMTVENLRSNEHWPSWLHDAWNLPATAIGSFHRSRPGDPHLICTLNTAQGVFIVLKGDWIVRDGVGRLTTCKAGVFPSLYEEVKAPAAA